MTKSVNTLFKNSLATTMPTDFFAKTIDIPQTLRARPQRCGKFSRIPREIRASRQVRVQINPFQRRGKME
ncbi:MAG TPA: hypothetical protein VGJ73_05045 [Verrucomicrobiae bacterium]|jgi:hypothetical protein